MFTYPKSFVDSPFFAKLSKHKLEQSKLSDAPIPVTGFVSPPRVPGRPPALRLTYESFNEPAHSSDPQEFEIPGVILNLNTIEEFKNLDKLEMVKVELAKMLEDIKSGIVLKEPVNLCRFFILCFSDLKKYKFYYWFMYPSFKWTSKITSSSETSNMDEIMAGSKHPITNFNGTDLPKHSKLGIVDFGSETLPNYLQNLAVFLNHSGVKTADIYVYRRAGKSQWIKLEVGEFIEQGEGWERNFQGKLVPKVTDLSSLMNPLQLANEAVDLNLKLMKWRAAPEIDLDTLSKCKCLLLGAGTLGSYIARGLLAWGVKHITFVDSGTVSYSNPVRQPLYSHQDCIDHASKAETAARTLKQIYPGVVSEGYSMEIPMIGHPLNTSQQYEAHEKLAELIASHDCVFLLMDSRESRWLPTVMASALQKITINVALGFDSYLVMRHGIDRNLGCYFCNDVVAPADSVSNQTLDQMCTVTRPGCAMVASGYAIELFARILQHKDGGSAPNLAETVLGPINHQLRGFLSTQDVVKVWGPAFANCSACGPAVELWREQKWDFVERALHDRNYLAEISGLADLQRKTEALGLDLEIGSDEDVGLI